jgi:hypothetical protein
VGAEWTGLRNYADSLKLSDMTAYSNDNSTHLMKRVTTGMKNAGRVQVVVSIGEISEKFFVTSGTD